MKNIHILPTDKPSRLIQAEDDELMLLNELYENTYNINKHIYITSDEEIKEGDYYYDNIVLQVRQWKSFMIYNNVQHKKVIATTDTSLYIHQKETISLPERVFYLPQPSQQFVEKYIEEYNKGNIITDVLVEYKFNDFKFMATLCTTKEKEYILKINPKNNTITIKN